MAVTSKSIARSEEDRLNAVIAQLKANRGVSVKPAGVALVDLVADFAADSVLNASRVAAGFAAAGENARYSFQQERERQTRRTAQRLLALAQ
jgi:hypothetical protein